MSQVNKVKTLKKTFLTMLQQIKKQTNKQKNKTIQKIKKKTNKQKIKAASVKTGKTFCNLYI